MYSIEKKPYGVKLIFGEFIQQPEMAEWVKESEQIIPTLSGGFGVFVDMRTLKPLPQDSQEEMEKGQKLYKQHGMVRSVVVLDNAVTTMQFKRIAKKTGIYEWERYIDASATPNWEKAGEDWIVKAEDPDKVSA